MKQLLENGHFEAFALKWQSSGVRYQLEQNFLGEDGEVRETVWSDLSGSAREVLAHYAENFSAARKGGISDRILFTLHALEMNAKEWETVDTLALVTYCPRVSG